MKAILTKLPKEKEQIEIKKTLAYSYLRFSTTEQLKGDSQKRQTEMTKAYIKENDFLVLDETINLQDLGISAYKGDNKTKGALGVFLRLVYEDKIPRGSYLLVETFDRLSREEIITALTQFLNIIEAGIKIVTLQDRMLFDKESIGKNGGMQLQYSIMQMSLANRESELKSERLKKVWETKRSKLRENKTILTKRLPVWIKVENDKFVLVQEVVHTINLIFHKKLAGQGCEKIAKELNQMSDVWKPQPSKRNKNGGWQKSSISKLIYNNRALIGEYQPHKIDSDGKRKPEGEPITNYFPKAISDELFASVQNYIKANSTFKSNGGGKKGKANNLFSNLVICGKCGNPLHYVDKGTNWKYLHCSHSRLKKQSPSPCNAPPLNYNVIQSTIFNDLEELNVTELMSNYDEIQNQKKDLYSQREKTLYNYKVYKKKINNLLDQMEVEDDKDLRQLLKNRYQERKEELEQAKNELSIIENKIYILQNNHKDCENSIRDINTVFEMLKQEQDEEKAKEIRIKINGLLKRLLSKIKIYPTEQNIEENDPNLIHWKKDEKIDRIVLYFKNQKKIRFLLLQGYAQKI